jgi:dihydrolipoamide dehydrogenase
LAPATPMAREVDVFVVGAGPGGYVAAIRCGQLGLKTLVAERQWLGGVCNHVGCIPSKALITASKLYRKAQEAAEIGLTFTGSKVDWPKVQAWKADVVKRLSSGVSNLLKGNKVDLLMGTARLTGAHTAEVRTEDGKVEQVRFKSCILAAGSAPIEIPNFKIDGKRVLTSTEALELPALPKRLVIIGAGAIGLEIACFYANFGTKVTVIELMPQVLPGTDAEVARTLERFLRKRGIELFTGAKAQAAKVSSGGVVVEFEAEGKPQRAEADHCLVAVGRRALTRELGLDAAGVKLHEKGWVAVNDRLQTNVPHIYAIGDLVGPPQLAHKASKEGIVAAEVIAGQKGAKRDFATIPGVIFTDPEVATAGLSEEEAKKAGYDVGVGKFPFSASGRALTARETEGFSKVVFDRKTHLVLGVHIVGPEASDLISEAALALEMGATTQDLALTVHPHPTLGEALMEAAEDAEGMGIHTLKRAG